MQYAGKWDFPPPPLGLPARTWVEIAVRDGYLIGDSPVSGTLRLYLQPDGTFLEEDSLFPYLPVPDDEGEFAGISDSRSVFYAAVTAAAGEDAGRASDLLDLLPDEGEIRVADARAIVGWVGEQSAATERRLKREAAGEHRESVEELVNFAGYGLVEGDHLERARRLFALNTRLFPESFNTWDSLGEAHMRLGENDEAIRCYEKSLELNENNRNAKRKLDELRGAGEAAESGQ